MGADNISACRVIAGWYFEAVSPVEKSELLEYVK